MINLTEAAQKQLESYFSDRETSAIRVYLASGG
jgi:Fe-S cluster assembly iron-binding protein IscA